MSYKINSQKEIIEARRILIVIFLALFTIDCSNKVEDLVQKLKNKDVQVRESTAEELGIIGDRQAVIPLITCLKDESSVVRSAAAEALGKIGDNRAVESLIVCLRRDELVRENAAWALGKIGDKHSVEQLILCLKDSVSGTRQYTAWVLGEIGDRRAVKPLIDCLKDEDEFVRSWSANALGKIGDKVAIQPLVSTLPDWDANYNIFIALEKLSWLPKTDGDWVYIWIGNKDKENLINNWQQTKRVLINDARSGEIKKIKNAVYAFISLGKEEIINDLVKILYEENDKTVAETYLNCGNEQLKKTATDWSIKHGYSIMLGSGGGKASWGTW